MSAGALKLELETVVSHLTWMLGMELRSTKEQLVLPLQLQDLLS